jgi:hypothetical protein
LGEAAREKIGRPSDLTIDNLLIHSLLEITSSDCQPFVSRFLVIVAEISVYRIAEEKSQF